MSEESPSLIINSPYTEPSQHWLFDKEGKLHQRKDGRRSAGYVVANPAAKAYQDTGIFCELPLVNAIRQRVVKWREAEYPGITSITRTLLDHWKDTELRDYPMFFCQIEAIETLIWLIETPDTEKIGIDIPNDGGEFRRLCSKLATGTGKTVVMAMLIAWQVLNRATYPTDGRFSQNIFIVAPNLTVRERLAVLIPGSGGNYYDEFEIVPLSLKEKLRQAKVLIRNWHALNWDTEEKIKARKGVDKRGAKSDEAYIHEVLGEMENARNLIVINDEAHHAWRVPVGSKVSGVATAEIEEATKWIGGLDRIHKTRGILTCFDFSATPFAPSGKKTSKEALFEWTVSDFGLNDAIESGLVKTPRIVVRDDGKHDPKTYKSLLYHIYSNPEVKDDLNRKAQEYESLPDLVLSAYTLLGSDWEKTKEEWSKQPTPPVMITVANRTETAARIKHAFDSRDIPIESLSEKAGILHIDSKVLKDAESREKEEQNAISIEGEDNAEKKLTQKEQADLLRQKVNTVGQEGKPGTLIQNVISVGMLSEGWDARTVTHIMGLRAFTSQLLCEQVIGRGLRRASYDINKETGFFDAEYVNVFGVPFSFLPHEDDGKAPKPPKFKHTVMPDNKKKDFSIAWPNIIRIDRIYNPELSLDFGKVKILELNVSDTPQVVEMAPMIDGQADVSKIKNIDLESLMKKQRRQTIIFKAAKTVWQDMQPKWEGSTDLLIANVVKLAEQFLDSDRIEISPEIYNQDKVKRQVIITLNMQKIIQHFWQAIKFNNTEKKSLVLDSNYPIRSTGDMRPWRTGKPCESTKRSHINLCVFDSTWESSVSFELDRNAAVAAWVKNDHLGFDILYVHRGVVRKYRPDFLIRLESGEILVLEVKGQQTEQDDAKHDYMRDWISAVNEDGRFRQWKFDILTNPSDIKDILANHSKNSTA